MRNWCYVDVVGRGFGGVEPQNVELRNVGFRRGGAGLGRAFYLMGFLDVMDLRCDRYLTFFCFVGVLAPTKSGGANKLRFFVLLGFRPPLKVGVLVREGVVFG